jgi:protein-L-isoaspartate(D-aspartate) O-methyltransferase
MGTDNVFEPLRRQLMSEVAAQLTVLGAQLGCRMLSERVMQAMERVPRHEFVPPDVKPFAYMNTPLPIGFGKTISQPFIVALMTELLALTPGHRVLEIGTGLGYQAAILAELECEVYSVELIPECPPRPPGASAGSATAVSACAWATAGWGGPSTPRSTVSSSPRRPI